MKKRIVALLLVLVLTMAMMVPVFAATVQPRAEGTCPYCGKYALTSVLSAPYERAIPAGGQGHNFYAYMTYLCGNCLRYCDIQLYFTRSGVHDGPTCSICGFSGS